MQLYVLGQKFPNSGTLYKELKHFLDWLQKREEPKEQGEDKKEIKEIQNPEVLISILINLAYNNPRLYPLVTGSIRFLIVKIVNEVERKEIISKIIKKFNQLPNTNYLNVWLQRLTLKINVDVNYTSELCKKVTDKTTILWKSEWLNPKFKKIVDETKIIDDKKVKNLDVSFSKYETEQTWDLR